MDRNEKTDTKMDLKEHQVEKSEEVDKLVKAIGPFGKWQFMLWLMTVVPIRTTAAWQHMGIVFIAPTTTFTCTATNLTDSIESGKCYSDCVKYEYFSEFGNTIISEWDLICNRAWLANFTQTLCMFGVLVGSIFFGFIADRYGRRRALLIASMLQLVTTFVEPFCPTYGLFSSVRFLIGLSTAGTMLCSFILMMEIIGPKKRELMSCLCALPLTIGQMLMPIFAYYLRTWDRFSLGVAVPNIIFLMYFLVMPESPKWLISVGKLEDASKVMTQAARWNNLPSINMMDVVRSIAIENAVSKETQHHKATYLDLLKTRVLRIHTLCSCFIWFILGISFYGSNQYVGQTSSNVFVSMAFAGALQIPGIMLSGLLCKYLGRKITQIILFGVCGVSNAFLVVPDDWYVVKLIMGPLGIGCASGAFATMYMYTSELFPTLTRNMAMGASSTVSRVGSMIAPYVASLTLIAAWLPPTAFAIVPILGAVTCLFLPETRGKPLSDHLA